MNHDIPDNLLQDISACVALRAGLYFPRKKWHALKKAAQTAATACGMDAREFLEGILSPPHDKQLHDALVTHLTIGETYFFRDKHLFQILKEKVLRELLSQQPGGNQSVNILSAGCASGEEPYSIAILLDHAFPMIRKKNITVIGTDINPLFLKKAGEGVYSRWSLRETPEAIINRYFTTLETGFFELSVHIRDSVRFRRLNLMENDYPSHLGFREPFHVILCRNVLMYFKEPERTEVLERLTRLLAENGWLITGPAETGFVQSPRLTPVRFSNTMLHRKCAPTNIETKKNHYCFHDRQTTASKASPSVLRTESANFKTTATLSGRPDENPDLNSYQEALDLYQKGNYAEAASRLEALMEEINTSGAAFLMAPEAMILLAKTHANLGRVKTALQWCDRAIADEKLNPEIHFLRATILQSAGDIPAAIQSLKQALFLDPDFVMAHFMMGLLIKSRSGEKSLQNALALLRNRDPEDILPFSEGMTAARLSETIARMIDKKGHA